jgi:hypothetical protein
MSDSKPKDPAGTLEALVREAKHDRTPLISDDAFASMEERIVARMALPDEGLQPVPAAASAPNARSRALRVGALVLAAAAAVVVVTKKEPAGVLLESAPGSNVELTASALRSTEGTGEVRVGGRAAALGHVLRAGDVVEADGARALLDRPRKVAWLIEGNEEGRDGAGASRVARARVKSAGESLILGLEAGAIEAQVTPVPSGEAFAVDIAAGASLVRVAVHGTHLRVSRVGSRVVVDLTEGVVSIGVPPRTGSTYGTLVTAPSHVEFDAADLDHTLRVEHALASVRAPVPLAPLAPHEPPVSARGPAPTVPAPGAVVPLAPATVPRPGSMPRAAGDSSHVEAPSGDRSKPALPPREAIAAAVRSCAAARRRPENVHVTVSSSLKLKIASGGEVETAQFDPPLLPEIQTCAAAAIYKAKLEDSAGANVTIPIDFSY